MGNRINDILIDKTAKDLDVSIDVVDVVISNQFKQVNRATKVYNEVEISGFGKLLQSQSKIKKRLFRYEKMKGHLEKLLQEAVTQEKVIEYTNKLERVSEGVEFLKKREKPKDEIEGNLGGMEKSFAATAEA